MRILVTGSRGITDRTLVAELIERSGFEVTELINGGASGVDACAREWAVAKGIKVRAFPYPRELGRRGGPARNSAMVLVAEACVAVWDGKSPGTQDCWRKAVEAGLPTVVWTVRPGDQPTRSDLAQPRILG